MDILVECGILFGICIAGELITAITHLPVPGNVFGMAILFILLCTGVLKKSKIHRVSRFLLDNMAFFFIPSGIAIIAYYNEIRKVIVPLLLIIVFSTVIVMSVTGQCAQITHRIQQKFKTSCGRKQVPAKRKREDVA